MDVQTWRAREIVSCQRKRVPVCRMHCNSNCGGALRVRVRIVPWQIDECHGEHIPAEDFESDLLGRHALVASCFSLSFREYFRSDAIEVCKLMSGKMQKLAVIFIDIALYQLQHERTPRTNLRTYITYTQNKTNQNSAFIMRVSIYTCAVCTVAAVCDEWKEEDACNAPRGKKSRPTKLSRTELFPELYTSHHTQYMKGVSVYHVSTCFDIHITTVYCVSHRIHDDRQTERHTERERERDAHTVNANAFTERI